MLCVAALSQLGQGGSQLVLFDGLEQIVAYAQLDRGLRVLEVRVAADNDDFDIGNGPSGPFDQFEPLAARHADVGDEDIRPLTFDQRQRFQPVSRRTGHLDAQCVPVGQQADQAQNARFIVGNYHLEHSVPSFPKHASFGISV